MLGRSFSIVGIIIFCIIATCNLQVCTSVDPKKSWLNIFNVQAPEIRNYDDYMEAANEYVKSGDSHNAIEMYRKAVKEAELEYGPNDLRIATSSSYLAAYCQDLGLFGEAETYYRKALAVNTAVLGSADPETIRIKKALAVVLAKLFKEDEAKALLKGIAKTGKSK